MTTPKPKPLSKTVALLMPKEADSEQVEARRIICRNRRTWNGGRGSL
ncbi:hypothetical protein MOMMJLID_CDS0058 [Arthrobacter phage 1191A]|nr:hypothetical protein MOMMJLID_CDS0058 [Arthrobacter phage 1191A]